MNKYSDSFITINKESLLFNARYFLEKSNKKLIAVIKSNAYGHDMITCANILKEVADLFAVASLDEAVELRAAVKDSPILVLNSINVNYVPVAIENNLIISVSSLAYLEEISQLTIEKPIQIKIKVDSGMNRMGVKTKEEYGAMIEFIEGQEHMQLVGVYTHFHTPNNKAYSEQQIAKFREIYHSRPYPYQYVHICSSNAVINNLDIEETSHVRVGIGLYGLADDENLKQVLSLYSKMMMIKEINNGEVVGYNANYSPREKEYIGVIPLGYSDGILRKNVGRNVYVDGYPCEIIGTICMNSLMIKLPHKEIKNEVEIIGPHVTTRYIAKYLNTITYEVVTCLFKDLNRIVI